MIRTADVVVVGAGIIGASIAYQLVRHGVRDVITVDKGLGPAEGSTGASSSVCRCFYTNPEVVRLAYDGQETYGNWGEFTRLSEPRSSLHRVGVVWFSGKSAVAVKQDVTRLTSQGVPSESLTADQLADLFPMLSSCDNTFDLTGEVEHNCEPGESFLFESSGGFAEPTGANQDLIEALSELGQPVEFRSPVTAILKEGDRVVGVSLGGGAEISAGLVINAAGPWCNQLSAMAGAEPGWTLDPTRAQIVYRAWPRDLGQLPVVGDMSTGIYFRTEASGEQVLVGSLREEDEEEVIADPNEFKRTPDAGFVELKLASLHHRIPGLEARGSNQGIAGLYTINREDVHPVVGPSGVDGFWLANGFSGHGFKLAPAIGSLVAQAVTGETMDFDSDVSMDFFSYDRDPIGVAAMNVLA